MASGLCSRAMASAVLPRLVTPRSDGHEYDVDHRGDRFWIRTNGGGRRNFRLVVTPIDDPRPGR